MLVWHEDLKYWWMICLRVLLIVDFKNDLFYESMILWFVWYRFNRKCGIRIYMNFEQKVTNPVGLKNDEKMVFLEHFGFEIRLKILMLCYKSWKLVSGGFDAFRTQRWSPISSLTVLRRVSGQYLYTVFFGCITCHDNVMNVHVMCSV